MTKFDFIFTVALMAAAFENAATGWLEVAFALLAATGFFLYFGVYKERQK